MQTRQQQRASPSHEGNLLVPGQTCLKTAPQKKGPSHLSFFERLGRGSIDSTITDRSRQPLVGQALEREPPPPPPLNLNPFRRCTR